MAKSLSELAQAEQEKRQPLQIRCCQAAACLSAHAQELADALEAIQPEGCQVLRVGCLGLCSQAPLVHTQGPQGNHLFEQVRPQQAGALLRRAAGGPPGEVQEGDLNHPFFAGQHKIVLQNSGLVEPERIESYLALGGYQTLWRVLHELKPNQVVEVITRSGLRGRGGAGYPTGLKWSLLAKSPAPQKYLVCNGDEGDPGAFMDRSVLESDPHRVLEGMALAAYAVGANHGYLYVRGEYPLAIRRLQLALKQAKKIGVLGSRILDTSFNLELELRVGAGAYVCGEETALIASIEGERGSPRPRPPYPSERGLWGCPTLINNVETYANVPAILENGADWFASIGTEKSKGTKVFALAGKVHNTGLVEVAMGTPLRRIVEDMGGGSPGGSIKAVQTGGPSGGCVPAEHLDTPVDYEALQRLGSIMGSGGMIVMDENDRMVDVARYFVQFSMDESCGKCIPCRAGTVQMYRILSRICAGEATPDDLARLEELCEMVGATSLCGLGQNAPNPVLSTLRFFRHEFEEGVRHGR
ncbi:MAG: NADH-quinone oxidoreductase subunit NuoF [Vulcanimicrobiota bacterium]